MEASYQKAVLQRYLTLSPLPHMYNNNEGLENEGLLSILQSNADGYLKETCGSAGGCGDSRNHTGPDQGKLQLLSHESFTFDWNVEEKMVNEWEIQVSEALTTLEHCNGNETSTDFNHDMENNHCCHLVSPKFQCGLLVNRCANWYLELRPVLVSTSSMNEFELDADPKQLEEAVTGTGTIAKPQIGIFIFIDKPNYCVPADQNGAWSWDFDKKINAFINVQLLTSEGTIYKSLKSEMLSFGFTSPPHLQSTFFPQLISWEEFLHNRHVLLTSRKSDKRCLRIRLNLDLFGDPHEKIQFKPSIKSRIMKLKKKSQSVEQESKEEQSDHEDPIVGSCAIVDLTGKASEMKKLLISGVGADVSVQVKGKLLFTVHREIIEVRAPGLATLISEQQNTINIDNYPAETIRTLIEYIYTDKISISPGPTSPDQINSLLLAGEDFRVRNFKYNVLKYFASTLGLTVDEEDVEFDKKHPPESRNSKYFETRQNAIDEKYLNEMDEFAKQAKEKHAELTRQFSEIFQNNTPTIAIVNPKLTANAPVKNLKDTNPKLKAQVSSKDKYTVGRSTDTKFEKRQLNHKKPSKPAWR